MPFPKGQNPHHPAAGSTIKVEPIRDKKAISRIKKILGDRPRDLCLFTLGINTAYRANELLSLKVGQVQSLRAGDVLDLKQRKTHKYRPVTLNATAVAAIQAWLASGDLQPEDYLFTGQRGCLTVEMMSTRVKIWCQDVGLKGNYGSHTLRKTWGTFEEIADPKNDYNLNLPRYIDSTEPEDMQDIDGHLRGSIPERDIDDLEQGSHPWREDCPVPAC